MGNTIDLRTRYLNKKEAMKFLTIKSYTTFEKYIINSDIPVYYSPFGERYKTDDLIKFMEQFRSKEVVG